jgi:hypothetical protein
MIVYPSPDLLSESSPAWKCLITNVTRQEKKRKEQDQKIVLTLLAFRTCSLLVGSTPNPVHETKMKSVSCPVCTTFIIVLINREKLHSPCISLRTEKII